MHKTLEPEELKERILKNLSPLDKLNFLEKIAVFLGKVQIIEMAMKHTLVNKYNQGNEINKCSLGAVIKELQKCGARVDHIALLKEVVTT